MKSENMIPKVYMQSWDMRTLCRIFDIEMEQLKYYTDRILDCYSPEHCPENLLPELAEHIGFDYQELKTVMYNRVVLKHFIHSLIRYRGSLTGIANAACIDVRYRDVYPKERFNVNSTVEEINNPNYNPWIPDERAGETIPMNYYEGIPTQKTWIDVDHQNAIIYLFIISDSFYPETPENPTKEELDELKDERMRRLFDLFYLQEYVRPVGMYLLPMVAKKVDARTDLTVKAIRITEKERNYKNGVLGTPNASGQHKYDRMHFARTEDGDLNTEPWLRTLYHSQIAGNLNHEYFKKPVYHIEGKFLYYEHAELQAIYSAYNKGGQLGMKIGDSLYNPNIDPPPGTQAFNYGSNEADEPATLQDERKTVNVTDTSLEYDDHGIFKNLRRVAQKLPIGTDKVKDNAYPTYLSAGDADDGTNKNLMINLFCVDEDTDEGEPQDAYDIEINSKPKVPRNPVPYEKSENDEPVGDDAYYTLHDDGSGDDIIP